MTSRRLRLSALAATVAVAALGLAGCSHGKKTPPEQVVAQRYLAALASGDAAGAAQQTSDPAPALATIENSLRGLGVGAKATLTVTGLADRQDAAAIADYTASWALPGVNAPWKYSGSLPVVKQGKNWVVSWKASDLHPQLINGSHLSVQRTEPDRAALQDRNGKPLFSRTPVVEVGINPANVANLPSLAATLAAVPQLQTSAREITTAVKAAPKNQFVPIITLRQSSYLQVKAKIHELKGTQFNPSTLLLPPTSNFAKPLLGSVGPATKELVDQSKGRVRAGDQTGLSGLQLALDKQLSGTAGVAVYAATDTTGALGAKLGTVTTATAGKPIRLTLDTALQEAADATLSAVTLPAALVALQPSTGKILAVANSGAATEDIALAGEYPAGSTFKIVTYTAAFQNNPGLTATSTAPCPATVTVNGRSFENENKFSHGSIPLTAAFGYSCNTTAINTAMKLPAGALHKAATELGLGGTWSLPVDYFSGSLPGTATGTELAAEAIGQGKVLVSPLVMASIAGAAASGKPVAPTLMTDRAGSAQPLPPKVTANLNALLRATISMPGATGYAELNSLPGQIRGKTGTAEFGTATPPKSHSWFAGTRGDLAIAVFVYGGEDSTTGAVPLARTFFTAAP